MLVLALNARFVQSIQHPGRTGEHDAVGAELVELSVRHDLPTFEILGHLIKIQVHAARGDPDSAERHVVAAERLANVHESPVVHVLAAAFRTMQLEARSTDPAEVAQAYRTVATELAGAGMPGVEAGFLRSRCSRSAFATGDSSRRLPTSTGPLPPLGPAAPRPRPGRPRSRPARRHPAGTRGRPPVRLALGRQRAHGGPARGRGTRRASPCCARPPER